MALSVTCSGCGSAVPAGDRFCGSCGNPITGSAILSGEGAAAFDPWIELLQKLRQATLGEYEIKGELGRGGMAAVFLAHDLHLNRKVAIKVMLPGLVYSERMWERFLAEARTAAKLDHPNIIYIHSVKEKDRFLYFVMKYVDGRPLDDLLNRPEPMPIAASQVILVEMARALDYAHREGSVHRDIKPANIMLDQKGNAIVMDFGIARVQDSAHFTQTGATIGTPAYMSPEQCHGHNVTAASDQYSLGIVAYEMLTGKPPFSGSPIELQLAHIQDKPKPIREIRKDVPRELADAVMKALEKDVAKRHASLSDLVRAFSVGADTNDPAIRDVIIARVKSGPPRRHSTSPTPASPPPGTLAAAQLANGAKASGNDTVHSAETAAVPWYGGDDVRSRPTAAVTSGPQEAATLVAPASDGHAGTTRESGAVPEDSNGQRSKSRLPLIAGGVAVLGIAGFLLTRDSNPPPPTAPAPDTSAAVAPAPTLGDALSDSVAVGHGPDAAVQVRGRAPKTVAADAVAILTPALSRVMTVGDTVPARLVALDDAGERVTSPQIVWTTSNASVVKFAGPGLLVEVKEGSATITVTAGGTTGTLAVTVGARRAARNSGGSAAGGATGAGQRKRP